MQEWFSQPIYFFWSIVEVLAIAWIYVIVAMLFIADLIAYYTTWAAIVLEQVMDLLPPVIVTLR